ncbi:MAG: hypothetical protein RIQ94_112 [Pseudomonadota bacterium]|jgi:ubiquinone/menaquinone biosynthesis C-methylase UbiE
MSRYDVEKQKWDEKSEETLQKRQNWKHHATYDEIFATYNVLRPVYEFFTEIAQPNIKVLDYGCGAGWTALLLAKKAAHIEAFDISEGRIAVLNKYIEHNNIQNLTARTADGEALPYETESFDYVFGNAILHHLRLDECLMEISRVLKPGGRAAFCEPMAHNPLINLYRYIKHHYVEDHLGTDQPLKYSDIATFQKYFSKVEFQESSFFRDRYSWLIPVDKYLLKVPFLKRYVCYVTVLLTK